MALPTHSDPVPSKIGPQSLNRDVRRYIADLLQSIDADITNEKAWEMAKMFAGNGYDALELDGKEWEKLFGETHGKLVYKRFVRFQNERFQNEYVDKDTIWPLLRHIYRIFILLLVIRTGRSFFEKEAFTIDKSWNIAAFIYFISYGFAYIFASAKSIDENPSWPEYFKIRPMGPKQKSWLSTLGYGG